jgi:hypothetical protein
VPDRVPAPDIGDLPRTVLPSRALWLTVRDMLCDARRGALADSIRASRRLAKKTPIDADLLGSTVLEAMWETVSCLELAANVAAPWVDPQMHAVHGRWAEMTRYDPSRVNRFYESSHKWSDGQFAALSGHRFDNGTSMVDVLSSVGFEDKRFTAAFEHAEVATARFLRDRFQYLASIWKWLRSYAAAYEHGLLLAPSAYGEAVDDHGKTVSPVLVVWATRKDGVEWPEGMMTAELIDHAESAGGLAIDLADYVADARLRLVESLEFDGDDVFLRPLQTPIAYWVKEGDLSAETMTLLDGMTLKWGEPPEGVDPGTM